MSEAPCYVYVIGTLHRGKVCGPSKIGISSNPHARLRELQTGSAHKLVIALAMIFDNRETARDIEQEAHWQCREYAMSGEWFDVHPGYAFAMVCADVLTHQGNCRLVTNRPRTPEPEAATQ